MDVALLEAKFIVLPVTVYIPILGVNAPLIIIIPDGEKIRSPPPELVIFGYLIGGKY